MLRCTGVSGRPWMLPRDASLSNSLTSPHSYFSPDARRLTQPQILSMCPLVPLTAYLPSAGKLPNNCLLYTAYLLYLKWENYCACIVEPLLQPHKLFCEHMGVYSNLWNDQIITFVHQIITSNGRSNLINRREETIQLTESYFFNVKHIFFLIWKVFGCIHHTCRI